MSTPKQYDKCFDYFYTKYPDDDFLQKSQPFNHLIGGPSVYPGNKRSSVVRSNIQRILWNRDKHN